MKRFITLTAVFIGIYLIIGFVSWLVFGVHYYGTKAKHLKTYTEIYGTSLTDNIFDKAFADAATCASLQIPQAREVCHKSVSTHIAEHIIEEEMVAYNDLEWGTWPHDLVFVKEIDGKFLRLGWDGVLTDITSEARVTPGTTWMHGLMQYLTRNCSYFGIYGGWACELVQDVQLPEGKGYIVLSLALSEEEAMLTTWYGLPPFMIYAIFSSPAHLIEPAEILVLTYSFATFIIPAGVVFYLYRHSKSGKRKTSKK